MHMKDDFAGRVWSAAIAGWWTLLIATVFLVAQWVAYLIVAGNEPSWLLRLWGPEMHWETILTIWTWMVATFKVIVWVAAMLVVWLSFWARRLERT